jgi:hypothetical protein
MMKAKRDQMLKVEWPEYDGLNGTEWKTIKGWNARWQALAKTELGASPGQLTITIDSCVVLRGLTSEEAEYIKG